MVSSAWSHSNQSSTYTALQRSTVNLISVELADSHGCVLVSIHFDESETAVRLETSLGDVAKVLEQRDQVILRGVRGEVANVAGRLPCRGLVDDRLIRLNTCSWELVVLSVRSGRSHAHLDHCLLLSKRRLSLLVGPVATNCARAQPLAIHGTESLVGVAAIPKSDKSVTARAASLHIPHYASFRDTAKGGEGLEQDLVIDLVGEITDEDVEVIRCVFLVGVVGLVSPVDTDFLILVSTLAARLM